MSDSDASQHSSLETTKDKTNMNETARKRKHEAEYTSHKGSDVRTQFRTTEETDFENIKPEDLSQMTRSERKRHREKKRRSDVNKGFDDLMSLLIEIDPDVRAEADEKVKRGQNKSNITTQEENLLSRVDLIGRTVDVLRRIHQENEENKIIISTLLRSSSASAAFVDPVLSLRQAGLAASTLIGAHRFDGGFIAEREARVASIGNAAAEALASAQERNQLYIRALLADLSQSRLAAFSRVSQPFNLESPYLQLLRQQMNSTATLQSAVRQSTDTMSTGRGPIPNPTESTSDITVRYLRGLQGHASDSQQRMSTP